MHSQDLDAPGISVTLDYGVKIGSLRYFDADGGFTSAVSTVLGGPIPAPLTALRREFDDGSDLVLAWRSPTETLILGGNDGHRAGIERYAAGRSDGCFVDQTGGIVRLGISGARTVEMLSRLGSNSVIPTPGQAHTARFAELGVTALCLRPGEMFLLVERVYAPHLLAWIRETLADF